MKINTLQILRAFAALSVLIVHVFQKNEFKPFGSYYLSGQYGVDIFFILSGFLIYVTTKKETNYVSYIKKRLFRIYPLYLVALVFYLLYDYYLGNLQLTFKVGLQNILMLPWDSRWSYQSLIVGVAWSTLFEMFFYTIFLILIILKINKRFILILIPLLLFVSYPLLKFKIFATDIPFLSLVLSLSGSLHLIMFLTGCIFGELFIRNKIPKISKTNYTICLILSIILIIGVLFMKYNYLSSYIACTFLFLSFLQFENYFYLNIKQPIVSAMIRTGDISYSIYIFHILIINLLIFVFNVSYLPILLTLTFIITILVSNVTYEYIERKFITLGKR